MLTTIVPMSICKHLQIRQQSVKFIRPLDLLNFRDFYALLCSFTLLQYAEYENYRIFDPHDGSKLLLFYKLQRLVTFHDEEAKQKVGKHTNYENTLSFIFINLHSWACSIRNTTLRSKTQITDVLHKTAELVQSGFWPRLSLALWPMGWNKHSTWSLVQLKGISSKHIRGNCELVLINICAI